jgi:hypothetical protein
MPTVTQPLSVVVAQPVAISSPTNGATITVPTSTSPATLPVSGTAQPGAAVSVTLDGGTATRVTAGLDGSWSTSFAGVSQGAHSVAASQMLADGPTTPVQAGVTVRVASPAVITSPQAGQQYQVAQGATTPVVVTGTGEPGARVSATLDGAGATAATVTDQGSWTATFSGVGVGNHTVTATQNVGGTNQPAVTEAFSVAAAASPPDDHESDTRSDHPRRER